MYFLTEIGEYKFWDSSMSEENGAVWLAPEPFSFDITSDPDTFVDWSVQDYEDSKHVLVVYNYLTAADKETVGNC